METDQIDPPVELASVIHKVKYQSINQNISRQILIHINISHIYWFGPVIGKPVFMTGLLLLLSLSNSLIPVVRPSVRPAVRLSVRPAKSLLGPKGPSPPQGLERIPP